MIELEVIDLGPHRTGVEGTDLDVVDLVGVGEIPRRTRQRQLEILRNGCLTALSSCIEAVDQGAVTAPSVALHLDHGLPAGTRIYGQPIAMGTIAVSPAVYGGREAAAVGIAAAIVAGALEVVVTAGSGPRATHHHGLLAPPLVGGAPLAREVAIFIYPHPEPTAGKTVHPRLEAVT
ncbi:hypothetical protein D3C79_497540 [compost metagenome]